MGRNKCFHDLKSGKKALIYYRLDVKKTFFGGGSTGVQICKGSSVYEQKANPVSLCHRWFAAIFSKKLFECSFWWTSGHCFLGELQVIMVPRWKHTDAVPIPNTACDPPLLSQTHTHSQVQLDCQAKQCLPRSLCLFIFLSVCLKYQDRFDLHGHELPSSEPTPPPQLRQILPSMCACMCCE